MDPLSLLIMLAGVALVGMAFHGTATIDTTAFPAWLKDAPGDPNLLPGGVTLDKAATFPRRDAVTVQTSAATLAGVTAIPVDALTGKIPKGTTINLGGVPVTLTADAAKNGTSLTVVATPSNIADNATGTYQGVGPRLVPEATLIGRTYAERDAGGQFGPWANGDNEVYLTQHDVPDLDRSAEVAVVRPGRLIAENMLPGWAARPAGEKTAIRTTFQCIKGQP